MSLTATMLEVPTGRVRVRRNTVEGPYEERFALIDALINELLATDYGAVTAADLPVLREHKPEAVQAYLAGDNDKALALDSTFLLAPLVKYMQNEGEVEAARFVWERRDRLSPRDENDPRINPAGTAGWATLNLLLSWQPLPALELGLRLQNLGDNRYREHGSGIDAAGLNLGAWFDFRF